MAEFVFPENEELRIGKLRQIRRDMGAPNEVVVRFHPHQAEQVNALPGFVPWWKYASRQKLEDAEAGSVEVFRLIPVREG